MKGLSIGRTVNFVMKDSQVRPMVIVSIHDQDSGLVNGVVFLDGQNDAAARNLPDNASGSYNDSLTAWATSTSNVEPIEGDGTLTPGSWHWPVKV